MSPLGRIVKSIKQAPKTYRRPDLWQVRSKYLSPDQDPPSDFRRISHQKYYWWKLGKLYADVPDYKLSQPRTYDTGGCLSTRKSQDIVTLKQIYWSFDEAHPALAEQHYLRTDAQNKALEAEKLAAERKAAARRRASESTPRAITSGCATASPRARERRIAGHLLRRASSEQLWERTRAVSSKAQAAIRRSEALTLKDENLGRAGNLRAASASPLGRPEPRGDDFARPFSALARVGHGSAGGDADEWEVAGSQHSATFHGHWDARQENHHPGDAAEDFQIAAARDVFAGLQGEQVSDSVQPGGVDGRMAEEEADVAYGRFSHDRFRSYNEEMDEESAARMQAGLEAHDMAAGYESDLERDEMARRHSEVAAALQELASGAATHGGSRETQSAQDFYEGNEWMDAYRRGVVERCKEEELTDPGYFEEVVRSGFDNPSPMHVSVQGGMSPHEQALLQMDILPRDIMASAQSVTRRVEALTGVPIDELAGYHSDGGNFRRFDGRGKPAFRPTRPVEMGFEKRARQRPKPISRIKFEQDLELKRREEEAAFAFRFVPNKVPPKSRKESDGLFEQQLLQQAADAHQRVAERKAELERMLHSDKGPFKFYERDMQKLEEKKRMMLALKQDINRFQVKFKAKPVPASVKQQRFAALQAETRAKKEQARVEAEEKLRRVNAEFGSVQKRVADAMAAALQPFPGTVEDNISGTLSSNLTRVDPQVIVAAQSVGLHPVVMALSNKYKTVLGPQGHQLNNAELHLLALARKNYRVRAKLVRQRHVDALWNTKYGSRKLGVVPDFDALHAQWEDKLATARRKLRQERLTLPEEFNFTKGGPQAQAARQQKQQEKRQRIILDQLLDDEELPEQRWPFVSTRAKVQATPPPAFPPVEYNNTLANKLRARHVQKAREHGQFDSKDDRERRAMVLKQEEMRRRAKAHVANERRRHRAKLEAAIRETIASKHAEADESPRIKAGHFSPPLPEHDPLSEAHRRGRHAQIERDIRQQTRELLLNQGLDVLSYVEGPINPRKIIQDIQDLVPTSVAQVKQHLQGYNDAILKQLLHEQRKEWEPSSPTPRADAIDRIAAHIYNYELQIVRP